MNKNIINYNDKGERHGYQEIYNWNNVIFLRANWKNHNPIGYIEYHEFEKTFYIIR